MNSTIDIVQKFKELKAICTLMFDPGSGGGRKKNSVNADVPYTSSTKVSDNNKLKF